MTPEYPSAQAKFPLYMQKGEVNPLLLPPMYLSYVHKILPTHSMKISTILSIPIITWNLWQTTYLRWNWRTTLLNHFNHLLRYFLYISIRYNKYFSCKLFIFLDVSFGWILIEFCY